MQNHDNLTDEQAHWLRRVLQSRPRSVLFDRFTIPDEVKDSLVEKGLLRLWRNGAVEITLDGIRAITIRPVSADAAPDTTKRPDSTMTA